MTERASRGGLVTAIAETLGSRPERIVLDAGDVAFTGAELMATVQRFAAMLLQASVRGGDRVVVQAEKSVAQAALYLATLSIGAIYVPLNPSYGAGETQYFLENSQPTLYVCDPRMEPVNRPAATAAGARTLTLDSSGSGSLAALVSSDRAAAIPVDDDALAVIIYTSGTTGRSKGAMLSHGNLLANATALNRRWGITATDVLLHALPLFHIHGLFVALNTLLLAGGRISWLPAFDPATVVAGLRNATLFMGVPTYYTRLLKSGLLNRAVAQNVRLFISGSAPLLPQTFADFEQTTGHRLVERYGMSECGIICSSPVDGDRIPGAVGQPLTAVELRIVDSDGRSVPRGATGEIEVRGPHVCHGYWRRPESRSVDFRPDGFFMTGDIGMEDARGYIHVVGRAKDLIISGGLNVYPREIELVLDANAGIGESAVIGVPHPDFGEAVVAVVCPAVGPGVLDAEQIIANARGHLAGFKLPKAVFIVEELPRNSMGKVQKAELRERFARTFVRG